MLRGKVSLQRKYNLTSIPIRSTKDILRAEEECFTKVWYGRKQSAAAYRAQGTPEYIIKGHAQSKRDAGVLIGFESEDDWFDYKLETNRVFLERVEQARRSLKAGRRIRLEDIPK
jgi:hypothetical protein